MRKAIQSKRKRDTSYYPEMHTKDVNSREIFKNSQLASQFLKKKVYIRKKDGTLEREVYVISLIEHKSNVDYDVSMQLLRYMTAIWQEYKKNREKEIKNISKRKDFRYPLIVPIVYYEGTKKWTADIHLRDRIEFSEQMEKYIPDFEYQIIGVNQYTNEELSRKHDEMSLIMLINKIQTPEDYEEFRKLSDELINSIYGNAPDEIKVIYKDILWALLMKMNVPSEEARELMGEIGGRGMGFLFENMEKMDIQAERRNTQREKERADAAELEIQRLKKELEKRMHVTEN